VWSGFEWIKFFFPRFEFIFISNLPFSEVKVKEMRKWAFLWIGYTLESRFDGGFSVVMVAQAEASGLGLGLRMLLDGGSRTLSEELSIGPEWR